MRDTKLKVSKLYGNLIIVICLILSLCSCVAQGESESILNSNDLHKESYSSSADNAEEDSEDSNHENEFFESLINNEKDEGIEESSSIEDEISSDNTDSVDDTYIQTVLSDPRYEGFDISLIPEYSGNAYISVNDNMPYFPFPEGEPVSFEYYSNLDYLGRCGVTYACIGTDIMPTEERGSIGQVKPTGWATIKYDIVDGKYLYNRCHLLGYQLTGENANTSNLITGTRYLNIEGMLPFENMVADYIIETEYHVLCRITPIFEDENLLATGVLMEGYSIEDEGDGICFNVFCYNVQPGIEIDYATGASSLLDFSDELQDEPIIEEKEDSGDTEEFVDDVETTATTYMCNKNTKKFHYMSCSSVDQMAEKNKMEFTGDRQELIDSGYEACKRCNP